MSSIVIEHLGKEHSPDLVTTTIGDREVVWEFGDYAAEYAALRTGAGLIDQSAGGPVRVSGAGALQTLQAALTRDVEFLVPERARMSLVLAADGRVIDVVSVIGGESEYLLLTGPGRAAEVEAALRAAAAPESVVEDLGPTTCVLAVEGPQSWRVVANVLGAAYVSLAYESSLPVEIEGSEALIARIGVTGEYGYTFVAPPAVAASLWRQFVVHGGTPVGHRARETAMFECRQPIVHREIGAEDTVVTAGLNWLVDPMKESFVGRDAVLEDPRPPAPLLPIGFRVEEGEAEVEDLLFVGPEQVGQIVYLIDSPGAGGPLGLAKVLPEWQAARLEFTTAAGGRVQTLAPPYVVPRSWSTPIEV